MSYSNSTEDMWLACVKSAMGGAKDDPTSPSAPLATDDQTSSSQDTPI